MYESDPGDFSGMSQRERRIICIAVLSVVAVVGVAEAIMDNSSFEPEVRVQGYLADGTYIDGLVDLSCDDGKVKETVHLVTVRSSGAPARGRKLDIQLGTTDADCDDTIAGYLDNRGVFIDPLATEIYAASPGGSPDGTLDRATKYRADLQASDLPIIPITG